jgi:hypothetical protein
VHHDAIDSVRGQLARVYSRTVYITSNKQLLNGVIQEVLTGRLRNIVACYCKMIGYAAGRCVLRYKILDCKSVSHGILLTDKQELHDLTC